MSSIKSLEAERESILARMQANRERYRRMLMENSDVQTHGTYLQSDQPEGSLQTSSYGHYGHTFADHDLRHNPAVQSAVHWVKEHPLLCVAAVAAVIAIGPRRIARTVVTGGSALTALTLRNQANVDMAGRLISQVVDYMQRGRTRPPR
jgi:hypothetical protein